MLLMRLAMASSSSAIAHIVFVETVDDGGALDFAVDQDVGSLQNQPGFELAAEEPLLSFGQQFF